MRFQFTLFLSILLSQSVARQLQDNPNTPIRQPADPLLHYGILNNGFTYYVRATSKPSNKIQIRLVLKAGEVQEDQDQLELAHMIEHLAFKKTTHFDNVKDFFERKGAIPGRDYNGYTYMRNTIFEATIAPNDHSLFEDLLLWIRDLTDGIIIEPKIVNPERGVILAEKRFAAKTRLDELRKKYIPELFGQTQWARRFSLETEENVKHFELRSLKRFYNDWYRPDLMAVIIVGNFDATAVESRVKSLFQTIPKAATAINQKQYSPAQKNQGHIILLSDKTVQQPAVELYLKAPNKPPNGTERLRRKMLAELFNEILKTRMSEIQNQNASAFRTASWLYRTDFSESDNTLHGLHCAFQPNTGSVTNSLHIILKELERLKRYGFTGNEIREAKTVLRAKYSSRELDNSESFIKRYTTQFLEGILIPPPDTMWQLMSTLPDTLLNDGIKSLLTDHQKDIAIVTPNEQDMPGKTSIRKWIKVLETSTLDSFKYEQIALPPNLLEKLAKLPADAPFTDSTIQSIDASKVNLINGVTIICKKLNPTGFMSDRIMLYGFRRGGASLFHCDIYQAALNAADIVAHSGIRGMDKTRIERYFHARNISATPFINDNYEGISGTSDTDITSLEAMFQMVHLFFTDPAVTSEGFNTWKDSQHPRASTPDPSTLLLHVIDSTLHRVGDSGHNSSIETLDKIQPADARRTYEERFASADGFTFILTGNFDKTKIIPLLRKYLGTLSSKRSLHDGTASTEFAPPLKVFAGQQSKARIKFVFAGTCPDHLKEKIELQTLARVLKITLMKRLREDNGAIYTLGANLTRFSDGIFELHVDFDVAAEETHKWINLASLEIQSLAQVGPDSISFQKALSVEERELRRELQHNKFWFDYLVACFQDGKSLTQTQDHKKILKNLSQEELRNAAARYLKMENLYRFVLLPSKI